MSELNISCDICQLNVNYIREARASSGNGTQTQSANSQNVDAESARNIRPTDSSDSRPVGQHRTIAGVSGNIGRRTDPEVSSGVNDVVGDSGNNVDADIDSYDYSEIFNKVKENSEQASFPNDDSIPKGKTQAKEDFAFAYDSIQKSAKRVADLKMFTEDARFKGRKNASSNNAVIQAVGNLTAFS